MPGNAFICFDGVKAGESLHKTNPGKDGWFEITDWSWDIEADTSYLKGGGAAVGKPAPAALSFSRPYDLSSPEIMSRIVKGTHFPNVHIVMLKQTGGGEGERYFGITMQEAFITKVSSKGGEDGAVTQDVEMVFKKCAISYLPQLSNNDYAHGDVKGEPGQLGKTPRPFTWDIGGMTVEGVDAMDLKVKGAK